jgi:hypothetical protein
MGFFWRCRAECKCNPVRYFAILSMQRSGSGWFETLLNNHTNISSNGEIFSVKVRRSNVSTITETLDKIYNLDWSSSASKNECTAAVGLKWMLNQVKVLSLKCLLVSCYFSLPVCVSFRWVRKTFISVHVRVEQTLTYISNI